MAWTGPTCPGQACRNGWEWFGLGCRKGKVGSVEVRLVAMVRDGLARDVAMNRLGKVRLDTAGRNGSVRQDRM